MPAPVETRKKVFDLLTGKCLSTFHVEPTIRRARAEERAVDVDDPSQSSETADNASASAIVPASAAVMRLEQPVITQPVLVPEAVPRTEEVAVAVDERPVAALANAAASDLRELPIQPLVPAVAPVADVSAVVPLAVVLANSKASEARARAEEAKKTALQASTRASAAYEALTRATGKFDEAQAACNKAQTDADSSAAGKTKTSAEKIATAVREIKVLTATARDHALRLFNAVTVMSLAATRSSVSFELVKDAASAVVKAELAVATLNLPVHESDVSSSEVLRSKETAC